MTSPLGNQQPAPIAVSPLVPGDVVISTLGPVFSVLGPEGFLLEAFNPQHAMLVQSNDAGGSRFIHSSLSLNDYSVGVTSHSAATALALTDSAASPGGYQFIACSVVFKYLDPLLPALVAKVGSRFAAQKKIAAGGNKVPATTHRIRNAKTEINAWITEGSSLYRALRAYDRYLTGEPLSKTQGVGCAQFAGLCIQQAILMRVFPKGVPESLLTIVRNMEQLKTERQVSKFSALPEAAKHLQHLVEIFEKELAQQKTDIPSPLLARYVDHLFRSTKYSIDGFTESFIKSGFLQFSGMLIHDGGKQLGCVTPALADEAMYTAALLKDGVLPRPIAMADEKAALSLADDYQPRICGSITAHIAMKQFEIECGLAKIQTLKEIEIKLDPPSPVQESLAGSVFDTGGFFRFRDRKKEMSKQLMNIQSVVNDAIAKISGDKGLADTNKLTKVCKLFDITVRLIKKFCNRDSGFDGVGAKQLLDHLTRHFKEYIQADPPDDEKPMKKLIGLHQRLDKAVNPEKYAPPNDDAIVKTQTP